MTRIKIKDLPRDKKITQDEMKKVFGGLSSLNLRDRFGGLVFSRSFRGLSPQPEPPDKPLPGNF